MKLSTLPLHLAALITSFLLSWTAPISAQQAKGTTDRILDHIWAEASTTEGAKSSGFASGFAILQDPEVMQEMMNNTSSSKEIDAAMEKVMLEGKLEPILSSLGEKIVQRQQVASVLRDLGTEEKIAKRFEGGFERAMVHFITSSMVAISQSEEFGKGVEACSERVDVVGAMQTLRSSIEKDEKFQKAKARIDALKLTEKEAAERAQRADSPLGKDKQETLKVAVMKAMNGKTAQEQTDEYFVSLLSNEARRKAIADYLRRLYGDAQTQAIWVDMVAEGIVKEGEADLKTHADKLLKVKFVKSGVESAFLHFLTDDTYLACMNLILKEAVKEDAFFKVMRDHLVGILEAVARP